MNILGKQRCLLFVAFWLLVAVPLSLLAQDQQNLQPEAEQLMALANRARAEVGAPPLRWDAALAVAAHKHTLRMVAEGPIQHVYPGELQLSERAGLAGAHFDLIEENIAIGPTPAEIHDAWMHSKGHRENMLNPDVNRVGIALVASRGVLYATADFSRSVQALSDAQVESRIAGLIAPSGVKVLSDHSLARIACPMDQGVPRSASAAQPTFVMRWQDSDISHLPANLVDQLSSGRYREAAVGSCQASGDNGTFTVYRVAVLLY